MEDYVEEKKDSIGSPKSLAAEEAEEEDEECRWFVLKQGKLLQFKDPFDSSTSSAIPRGVISTADCPTVKGAEDVLNKPFSFELSTSSRDTMYFVADSEKEKEDWINSIGRSIVQHSRSFTDYEVIDYNSSRA